MVVCKREYLILFLHLVQKTKSLFKFQSQIIVCPIKQTAAACKNFLDHPIYFAILTRRGPVCTKEYSNERIQNETNLGYKFKNIPFK